MIPIWIHECAGTICTKYIFAGDNRIAKKTSTAILYYHQDHLGSSRIITDSSGNKVEEIHYLPYGSAWADTNSVLTTHKFTGQELDAETGLYYYGARYYNPVLARFISPDSIVPNPADPQAFNRYSYVRNNPLIYIDPSGNSWLSEAFHDAEDWVSDHKQEITGMALQALGGGFFLPGTYMLSQTPTGRTILGIELAIGAAIVGYYYYPAAGGTATSQQYALEFIIYGTDAGYGAGGITVPPEVIYGGIIAGGGYMVAGVFGGWGGNNGGGGNGGGGGSGGGGGGNPNGNTFMNNWWNNVKTTNSYFFGDWGRVARTGIGTITSGSVAKRVGTVSLLDYLRIFPRGYATLGGLRGTTMSLLVNMGINSTLSTMAIETGIGVGSAVNAFPVYGTDMTVKDWWVDYWSK